MKQKALLIVGVFTALVFTVFAQEPESPPTITVATSPNYPPMEFIDKEGNLVGFDIDIMHAAAEEAGFMVAFTHVPFYDLADGLHAGRYDAIISGVTIVENPNPGIEFSVPYYWCDQVLLVKTTDRHLQDIDALQDLKGERVGVLSGSVGAGVLMPMEEDTQLTIVTYPTYPPMVSGLLAGDVDAVVVDAIYAFLATRDLEFRNSLSLVNVSIAAEPFGVVVRSGDTELLDLINQGLSRVIEAGVSAELEDKWFP